MKDEKNNGHPEHLDKWSRNARLYQKLLDDGLYVKPAYHPNDRTAIDYLIVSTGLPNQEQVQG